MADFWPAPKPAVAVAVAVLKAGFPSLKVASDPPGSRPNSYIVVGLLSQQYTNPAFTVPRVLVECWAKSSSDAEVLAGEAVKVMRNAVGEFAGAHVRRMSDIQGPVPLDDPAIGDRRRYQFHGDLNISTK